MIYNLDLKFDKQKALTRFTYLVENKKTIELTEKKLSRSLNQNSYLHLILGWFGMEFGYSLTEVKTLYKRLSKDIFEYEKSNIKFFKSSANINTSEMTISIERFRDWSVQSGGFYIPSPDEKDYLKEIEKQLKNSNYA